MRVRGGWSSHYAVLVKAMEICDGPILELGIGLFSTSLLHWLCLEQGKKLVSYEDNPFYLKICRDFRDNFHKVLLIDNWDAIDIENTHWGMAFIDHRHERRLIDARRIAHNADYVICHDTQESERKVYGYNQLFPEFKYIYHYTKASPNTTVLSNFKDLKKFL